MAENVSQSVKCYTCPEEVKDNVTSENQHQFCENCSKILQCNICFGVAKDIVACSNNEHIFCRDCITKWLESSKTCPVSREELTEDTLKTSRTIEILLRQEQDCKLLQVKRQLEEDTRRNEKAKRRLEELKKRKENVCGLLTEKLVFIAGGKDESNLLNSVEMFKFLRGTWTPLKPMRESRGNASSVVHEGQMLVTGGQMLVTPYGSTKSIEKLSLASIYDQSITWENFPAELPRRLSGHRCVVHNGRLIVIGGYDEDEGVISNRITAISLVPHYTSDHLATMPQRRCDHGVALFGDKILIFGGRKGIYRNDVLAHVVMYDIATDEFQELADLPYPVFGMATLKWNDGIVLIIGGADSKFTSINKVFMYNFKTESSSMLCNMNYARYACVAAHVSDGVIVMGGQDEEGNCLDSAEKYVFSGSWEDLPAKMERPRYLATAVHYTLYA